MEVRADRSTGTPDLAASPSDLVVLPPYLHTSAAAGSPHASSLGGRGRAPGDLCNPTDTSRRAESGSWVGGTARRMGGRRRKEGRWGWRWEGRKGRGGGGKVLPCVGGARKEEERG
jgi:hypothetical protein